MEDKEAVEKGKKKKSWIYILIFGIVVLGVLYITGILGGEKDVKALYQSEQYDKIVALYNENPAAIYPDELIFVANAFMKEKDFDKAKLCYDQIFSKVNPNDFDSEIYKLGKENYLSLSSKHMENKENEKKGKVVKKKEVEAATTTTIMYKEEKIYEGVPMIYEGMELLPANVIINKTSNYEMGFFTESIGLDPMKDYDPRVKDHEIIAMGPIYYPDADAKGFIGSTKLTIYEEAEVDTAENNGVDKDVVTLRAPILLHDGRIYMHPDDITDYLLKNWVDTVSLIKENNIWYIVQ